jgi:hypothetical protein
VASELRQQTNAKDSDVRPRFAAGRQDVAPTNDSPAREGNEVRATLLEDAAVERVRIFSRRRLKESQVTALARDGVKYAVKLWKVLFTEGRNVSSHEAYRLNELLGRAFRAISMPPSGLRVEPEDA